LDSAQLASSLGLIAYAISSMAYLASFSEKLKSNKASNTVSKTAFGLFISATVLVTASLLLRENGVDILADSGIILAELVGWVTIVAHLKFKLRTIGAFIAPLATLMLLIQFYTVSPATPVEVTGYPKTFLSVHIIMALLGEAAAIAACGFSGVYLRQQRLLKQRLLETLNSETPALDRLEWMLKTSLWAGFIFITASLLSGAFYSHFWGGGSGQGIKIAWGIMVWGWYLVTLISRMIFDFPLKRVAKMSFVGFLLLSTTFFGIMGLPASGGM